MPRASFKSAVGSFAKQGNRELPITLDFTNTDLINDDLFPEMAAGYIDVVQTVFVDNSGNPNKITFVFNEVFTLVVMQYKQGIYPVISSGKISYTAATTAGVKVPIIFSNTAKQAVEWGP